MRFPMGRYPLTKVCYYIGMTDTKTAPFSLKTVILFWLKHWPITIILVALGGLVGFMTTRSTGPSFTSEATFLVVNQTKSPNPIDYSRIAGSAVVLDRAYKAANISKDSCTTENSPAGDIVVVKAICSTNADDSKKMTSSIETEFSNALSEYYEDGAPKVFDISGESNVIADDGSSSRLLKTLLFSFTGLALSAVISFIWVDFKSSKK